MVSEHLIPTSRKGLELNPREERATNRNDSRSIMAAAIVEIRRHPKHRF